MRYFPTFCMVFCCLALLSGCGTARTATKVVTFPVKAVWYTGKGLYLTGKGVYKVGKGVYRVGSATVRFTDAALNSGSDVFLLTTRAIDLAGQTVETTRLIRRAELEAELQLIRTAKNIIEVIVDIPLT